MNLTADNGRWQHCSRAQRLLLLHDAQAGSFRAKNGIPEHPGSLGQRRSRPFARHQVRKRRHSRDQ